MDKNIQCCISKSPHRCEDEGAIRIRGDGVTPVTRRPAMFLIYLSLPLLWILFFLIQNTANEMWSRYVTMLHRRPSVKLLCRNKCWCCVRESVVQCVCRGLCPHLHARHAFQYSCSSIYLFVSFSVSHSI